MARRRDSVRIPLPRGWRSRVGSGMLHVISLAQCVVAYQLVAEVPGWSSRVSGGEAGWRRSVER